MKSVKNKYTFELIVLLLLLPAVNSFSQSVNETEKKYIAVSSGLNSEQRRLDSLNALLNDRAINISREKKKNNPDKERITTLMSNSITLSNQISELQKKIVSLESKREELKAALRKTYSKIIDSLSTIKLSKNSSDVDTQILSYSEKKLSIVQRFPDFSFNPAMIISIDPETIRNPEERKIFRDYLYKALNETHEKIKYVETQYSENNQVLSLQKKAEKFIEETEYTDSYRFSKIKTGAETAVGADYNNSRDYLSNAENVKGMLNQFRSIDLGDLKSRSALNTNISNLTLKDYQSLLKELKDNLVAFRTILIHKLKFFE